MREWSTYCQNADYLEKSRMMVMNRHMSSQVAQWIGVETGDRVLDVGCGSGELTFYLGEVTRGVAYTGLDMDEPLLERAVRRAAEKPGENSFDFRSGDALCLPFPDASFDVVVSQTLLTSVADYEKVMEEMRRVCRPGGRIASLALLDFAGILNHPGSYPPEADWVSAYRAGAKRAREFLHRQGWMEQYAAGIPPMRIPELFSDAGLEEVRAYPIGTFLSLSNAAMTEEDRQRFILLDHRSELEQLHANLSRPDARRRLSPEEIRAYEQAMQARRQYLLSHIRDNAAWEWTGGTFLLVVGENTRLSEGGDPLREKAEALRESTRQMQEILRGLDVDTEESWIHSGAGKTASVQIDIFGTRISAQGWGITPVHARHAGYAALLEKLQTDALAPFGLQMPDEGSHTAAELESLGGALLEETLYRASLGPGMPPIDLRSVERQLGDWSFAAKEGRFATIPFRRLSDGSTQWIPAEICRAYYGSGGVASGDTGEEAMVRALSRVAQHWAARRILLEKKTPPLLPGRLLEGLSSELKEALCALEHMEEDTLRLVDASCGVGLPVVGAVLVNRATGTGLVRFGAHPCLETALSECISGLMAGRRLRHIVDRRPFNLTQDGREDSYLNRFNLMEREHGIYPACLLDETPDWECRAMEEEPTGTAEQLEWLLALYRELGWEIYLRECGFLGRPTVQVLVPGESMLHDFGVVRMRQRRMAAEVASTLRNMAAATEEQRERGALFAKIKRGWQGENRYLHLTGIPYTPEALGVELDAALLCALALLQRGEYDQALKVLEESAQSERARGGPLPVLCRLVQGVMEGEDRTRLGKRLRGLYPARWVEQAEAALEAPLEQLPSLDCPNCTGCGVRENCCMPATLQLAGRMGCRMAGAQPSKR